MMSGVDMDGQTFFNIAVGVIGGLGGWLLNTIWSAVRDLQKSDKELADKVSSIEVLVAGRYVTREEFQSNMDKLFGRLDKIAESVGRKADR
jgi:hypothetical protein